MYLYIYTYKYIFQLHRYIFVHIHAFINTYIHIKYIHIVYTSTWRKESLKIGKEDLKK